MTPVDVSVADLNRAWLILNEYADQEFSLVDAVSFAVMERLGIPTAFSFDAHFRVFRYGPKKELTLTVVP